MNTSKTPKKEPQPQHEDVCQSTSDVDDQLDNALDDSFPASDVPAAVTPGSKAEKKEEDALDDALDDSFPASDPPSTTQPG